MTDTETHPPQSEPARSETGSAAKPPDPNPNREIWKISTTVFSLLAFLLAFVAVVTAGQAWSRSNEARSDVKKLAAGALLSHKATVSLREFSIAPRPTQVKAGSVQFTVHNVGTITHEMVLVRAASPAALPRVATATSERAVGDVDEEAISKADTIGETGDVKAGKTVVKTFKLTPGTYVMFCNIDNAASGGGVLNHFSHGMTATITAS
jgi:uncharacterized cupredoxin-like copper-binding protein